MSSYIKKMLSGVVPTPSDWEELLIEAHKNAPSMSPAVFAACRNERGLNSYEWAAEPLRDLADPKLAVDLACGDGFLVALLQKQLPAATKFIGIDMAESGLQVARARKEAGDVEYFHAKADQMPLETGSVDAVVCHMGFMLMLPVEPVAQEILRVLKSGGLFVAVLPNRETRTGLLKKAIEAFGTVLKQEYPSASVPRTGDPRTDSVDGVVGLFKGGAALVSAADSLFGREVGASEVWDPVKTMYLFGALPTSVQDRVRETLELSLGLGPNETTRFELGFLRVVLRKN